MVRKNFIVPIGLFDRYASLLSPEDGRVASGMIDIARHLMVDHTMPILRSIQIMAQMDLFLIRFVATECRTVPAAKAILFDRWQVRRRGGMMVVVVVVKMTQLGIELPFEDVLAECLHEMFSWLVMKSLRVSRSPRFRSDLKIRLPSENSVPPVSASARI